MQFFGMNYLDFLKDEYVHELGGPVWQRDTSSYYVALFSLNCGITAAPPFSYELTFRVAKFITDQNFSQLRD